MENTIDDAVSVDGIDYFPINKPNYHKDYELIYYINDVTIDNEEVLVEYGATGVATGTYEYGLQRLSVEYVNEAKGYYLYNGTGSVVQTTAQNGSTFLRYTYDAFGNITSIRSPMTVDVDDLNRYTYNGEDYDYNTSLQYLRARYYDTSVGSFISQDTYLGDLLNPLSQNRYTYCHNSPIMFDDPSGHFGLIATIVGGAVIGGLVDASLQVAKNLTEGKSFSESVKTVDLKKVGMSALSGALAGVVAVAAPVVAPALAGITGMTTAAATTTALVTGNVVVSAGISVATDMICEPNKSGLDIAVDAAISGVTGGVFALIGTKIPNNSTSESYRRIVGYYQQYVKNGGVRSTRYYITELFKASSRYVFREFGSQVALEAASQGISNFLADLLPNANDNKQNEDCSTQT